VRIPPSQKRVGRKVFFGTGRAAEGSCVLIYAAVADASGFAGCVAQHWVTGEHAEALGWISD
jgi:hypothetical protein